MRTLIVSLALVGLVHPAFGSKRVTVEELEKTIAAAESLPDVEAAGQLSGLELTERLGTAKFDRMEADLPGKKSRQALMILADASAFLNPPADELPNLTAPDLATQRKILALTVNYVTQTLQRLPNFFATRVTENFEDMPAVQRPGAITSHGATSATAFQPLHLVDDSNVTVSFRDGREVVENSKLDPLVRSLTTSGVFGPILSTVLVDAAQSNLAWSHWEQGQTGLQAVFSYKVPMEKSHYTITYDSAPSDPTSGDCSATPKTNSKVVAYHGEMAIEPASGTILRLMLLADMKPDEMVVQSGIEVEYGEVSIGGKDYFLPVRSVTSSLAHPLVIINDAGVTACPYLRAALGRQTSLNNIVFKNYHVFRADASMLTGSEASKLEDQPSPTPIDSGSKQSERATASSPDATTTPVSLPPGGSHSTSPASTAANAETPSTSESRSAVLASDPTRVATTQLKPVVQSSVADIPGTPVLRTTTRQVLVDIVVDKKNGDPVPALPKSDFSIEEDGKPQTINFFDEHSAGMPVTSDNPAMPPMQPGAISNVPAAPLSSALYVFLLDSLNSEPQDQVNVRQQVLTFLQKLDPGTEVAVFSLGSSLRLLQGFTSDPHLLLAALSPTHAERAPMAQTRSDNADDAQHMAHLAAMHSAVPQLEQYSRAESPQAYSFGARTSMTFEALSALARYLEGIPGRKNLIWFSSSFPVVFFPTPSEMEHLKNNPALRGYMNHVQQTANLFTLSKIAVYPVSGTGVASSNIDLAESAGSRRAGGSNGTGAFAAESLNSASALASMTQLASSTGGRAFTTNDIGAALRAILHESDVYYTVGYSPSDATTDDGFRRIDVKVSGGKYKLAYRHGYNAESSAAIGSQQEDPIVPLLQYGLPDATGILYGASVTPSTDHDSNPAGQNPQIKGSLTRYTVSFTLRAQDVSFGRAPNGERIAKLLIGVKAYGGDGSALNWQANREDAELTPEQYASILTNGLPVKLEIDLPAKLPAQLVTAVYDWNTGRAGTLEIPLHP